MGVAGGGLSGRGLLVGMAAGAMLGVLLGFAMSERPRPAFMTIDDEVRAFAMSPASWQCSAGSRAAS